MRKVRLFIAASLDGYIAGKDNELGWLYTDQDYGYTEFIGGIDAIVLGRKTLDVVASFGEWPYGDIPGYVFSRHDTTEAPYPQVRVVNEPVDRFIAKLRREPGKDIWLAGGGELVAEFLRHDLIDEFAVSYHPILLGAGVPLFPGGYPTRHLDLKQVQPYESGLLQVTYARHRAG